MQEFGEQSDSQLIDHFLPEYDIFAAYERTIAASASDIFRVIREGVFGDSWIIRCLFAIRSLPHLFKRADRTTSRHRGIRLRDLTGKGFHILGEWPDREIVVGVIGCFWKWTGNIKDDVTPESFKLYSEPGYCKAVWNFRLQAVDDHRTRVITETRIQALDKRSRQRFKFYWLFVGPFSGLIRIVMLRDLEKQLSWNRNGIIARSERS